MDPKLVTIIVVVLVIGLVVLVVYIWRSSQGSPRPARPNWNLREGALAFVASLYWDNRDAIKRFLSNATKLTAGLVLLDLVFWQVGWASWGLITLYLPLLILLALREMAQGGIRTALAVLAVIGFTAAGVVPARNFFACDEQCRVQKVAEAKAKAKALAELRLAAAAEKKDAVYGEPAKTPDCPGTPPDFNQPPVTIGAGWDERNPKWCDFVYGVISGGVEFDGPNGTFTPSATGAGRTSRKILAKVRATTGTAQIYFMLCPKGLGPDDGGWECRRQRWNSPLKQAGIFGGLF